MKRSTTSLCTAARRGSSKRLGRRLAVLGYLAALLVSGAAYAGVKVTVTTTADEFGGGSSCSLREALYTIHHAAAFGGCTRMSGFLFDNISVPAGTYAITLLPNGGNAEAGGAFKVYAALGMSGAGAGKTIVDGASIDSVFYVAPGSGNFVTMSGMTIRGGLTAAYAGAGIAHVSGRLSLQKVLVTANLQGFGISSGSTEDLTLRQVTVSNNQNTGVYISENLGAATTTTVLIENTTISGNVAPNQPGGLHIFGGSMNAVSATINNSTIAYNVGQADGQLFNTTGGLLVSGSGPTVYLRNSIIARNIIGSRALTSDCIIGNSGNIVSQGNNLIENQCSRTGNTGADITGVDPLLAPLFDYGGGIPTHAAFPGSLALNAGNSGQPGSGGNACAATDARGIDRTQTMPCDIGAYEYHADFSVQSTTDASDDNAGDGVCHTTIQNHLCTLRAAIDEANAATGPVTIYVPAGRYTITKPPVSNFIDNIDGNLVLANHLYPVTLVGAGADNTIIDGGQLDGVMTLGDFGFAPVSLHGLTLSNGKGFGSGLAVYTGSALVDRARVTGNLGYQGNGIWLYGSATLTLTDSTVDGNTSNGTAGEGGGAGIFASTGSQLNVLNSTISNNFSHAAAGGIFNDGATVSIAFSTIANNTQYFSNINGGGVASGINGGTWHVTHSIIANNKVLQGVNRLDSDCATTLQIAGDTLVRDASGCTFGGQANKAHSGIDPLLAPLLMQGGTTPTIATLAASPVHTFLTQPVDCVDVDGRQMLTDQRGMPRPTVGYGNPQYGGYCDIGAFQGVSDVIFADGFE